MSGGGFDLRGRLGERGSRPTIRDARSDYARTECDHCQRPIGYYGAVREGLTGNGVRVPLAAICPECATAGKRL